MTTRMRVGFPASLREIKNIQRGSEFRLNKASGASSPDIELTKIAAAGERVFLTSISGYNASSNPMWIHAGFGSSTEFQLQCEAGKAFSYEFNNIPIFAEVAGADMSLKLEGLSGTPDLTGSYLNCAGWIETEI